MARVYLKGLPELKKKLAALKEKTEAEITPVVARAADDVVAMMKRQVPVDDGTLRDSIGWTFGEPPKGSISVGTFKWRRKGGFKGGKPGFMTVTIYAGNEQAFYARFIEFGTRAHTITAKEGKSLGGKGGRFGTSVEHPGGAARPFFFPSWRASKKPITRAISRAIQKAVRDVSRT